MLSIIPVNSFSEESPQDALDQALELSIEQSEGASNVSIVLTKLASSAHGWHANLELYMERSRADHEASEEHEYELDRIFHEQLLEHAKEAIEKKRHKEHQIHEEELDDEEFLHLYLESIHEPLFRAIEERHDIDYVHVMEAGSLMEASRKRHPDMDLHRAAHPENKASSVYAERPPELNKDATYEPDSLDEIKYKRNHKPKDYDEPALDKD